MRIVAQYLLFAAVATTGCGQQTPTAADSAAQRQRMVEQQLKPRGIKDERVLAAMANGRSVRTVEDLEQGGVLDPVQQGFMNEHGLQCGFCTPAMMMTARALLDRNAHPSNEEIRVAISGTLCRCTGYENIVRSIRWAAENPITEGAAS